MATNKVPGWTFADRIRKVRRELGMSQADFSEAIGVTRQALASWEAGSAQPGHLVDVARAIEGEFGYSAAWLLGLMEAPVTSGATARYALRLSA
jgi:transcriptional regulator with XRE-family HTH domain